VKRLPWLAVALVTALVVAAVALATNQALSTKSVTATFTATPSTSNKTSTCKGADGDYTRIDGSYTGTATSSEGRLAGPITISGQSLVNKTTGLGWMKGSVRIDASSHQDTRASFTAVISGGQLNGFLNGRVHDASGNLIGGLNAAFGATGITGGSIGTTSSTAALIVTGGCAKENKKDGEHDNGKHKGKH
jgi:hypothetical protein